MGSFENFTKAQPLKNSIYMHLLTTVTLEVYLKIIRQSLKWGYLIMSFTRE